jgi:hypothetical protein
MLSVDGIKKQRDRNTTYNKLVDGTQDVEFTIHDNKQTYEIEICVVPSYEERQRG